MKILLGVGAVLGFVAALGMFELGGFDRTYPIGLTAKAQHTAELGRWEAHPDGSEIRYRAKWN